MKKIKYLSPILGLTALVGVAAPIATSCAGASTSTVLPVNLLDISGNVVNGVIKGTDLTKYDTIEIPEGIKSVASGAFYAGKYDKETGKFTYDYTNIKTLKLPSTLRTIGGGYAAYLGAFTSLSNLKKIDLTSWNTDTIHFCEIGQNAFGVAKNNSRRYCKIQLPQGLSQYEENLIKNKLVNDPETGNNAGCPIWWFDDLSTGHVNATEGVEKENNALCTNETVEEEYNAQYAQIKEGLAFTLTQPLDTNKYEIIVYPEITSSTKIDYAGNGDKIYIGDPRTNPYPDKPVSFKDSKNFTTQEVRMGAVNSYLGTDGVYSALYGEGDVINYDANVVCYKKNKTPLLSQQKEVVWVQKVEGFKSKINVQHVTNIEVQTQYESKYVPVWLDADPTADGANIYKLDKINDVKVTPENAIDTSVVIESSAPEIVDTYNGFINNYIIKNMVGTSQLIFYSEDRPSVSDAITVDVVGTNLKPSNASTVFGHVDEEGFGYTIPAYGKMLYQVTLDETTAAELKKSTYSTDEKYRTFGVYENKWDGSAYNDQIIVPETVYFMHNDKLLGPSDYGMKYGAIYLFDAKTAAETIEFADSDTLTFYFEFNNPEPINFTGFKFQSLKKVI